MTQDLLLRPNHVSIYVAVFIGGVYIDNILGLSSGLVVVRLSLLTSFSRIRSFGRSEFYENPYL